MVPGRVGASQAHTMGGPTSSGGPFVEKVGRSVAPRSPCRQGCRPGRLTAGHLAGDLASPWLGEDPRQGPPGAGALSTDLPQRLMCCVAFGVNRQQTLLLGLLSAFAGFAARKQGWVCG